MPQPFDPIRYPYAALALTVPGRAKDHFAAVVSRNRVAVKHATRIAETLIAQKVRKAVPAAA